MLFRDIIKKEASLSLGKRDMSNMTLPSSVLLAVTFHGGWKEAAEKETIDLDQMGFL